MKSGYFPNATTQDTISDRSFNLILGAVLLYGFALNWWMVANIPLASIQAIPLWMLIVGYLVSCFAGIILYNSSSTPVVSFIGYNLVVIPFGVLLNLIISPFSNEVVVNALQLTTVVTVAMMFMATLFPAFFKSIFSALLWGTGIAILVEISLIIFTGHSSTIMDWIVAILFCGWIGYDFARSNELPKTVDNAIDGAANLYMSIINLFSRLLSLIGD